MSGRAIDFWIVVGMMAIAAYVGYILKLTNVPLGFLYLGVPSIYLCLRAKKNYKKIGWGILIFGILFGFIFDFIQQANGVWRVPRLLISWKLFGFWPIENIFGYIFMTLFILVFYEHFLDRNEHPRLSRRHSELFIFALVVVALIIVAYAMNPTNLQFSHAYLYGGLAAIVFPILFSIHNPKILPKFAQLAIFFFFVWLLLEIVGVRLGNWAFPDHGFIGYATIFGATFPIEEILFWMMWYPATIVAYYEYFLDHGK